MDISFIFLLFMIKHFICDFPLQSCPYIYQNKGIYGHLGGITHAIVHGLGTLFVMVTLVDDLYLTIIIITLDMFIHYHIDYLKMRTNNTFNLRPDNSEWFWILLGFDQLLHFITYYWFVQLLT